MLANKATKEKSLQKKNFSRKSKNKYPLKSKNYYDFKGFTLSQVINNFSRIQRKPTCACDGGCPSCANESIIQTKLIVNHPGDRFEKEADRISKKIINDSNYPSSNSLDISKKIPKNVSLAMYETKSIVDAQKFNDSTSMYNNNKNFREVEDFPNSAGLNLFNTLNMQQSQYYKSHGLKNKNPQTYHENLKKLKNSDVIRHNVNGKIIQRQKKEISEQKNLDDCSNYIRMGGNKSCFFYLCREKNSENKCKENEYYNNYGFKYCKRFTEDLQPRLSKRGKIWLNKTRSCLMEYINKNIGFDTPCHEIKRLAFNSHPSCYVKSGICFLPPNDLWEIFNIVDQKDFDLIQVLRTGGSCLKKILTNFLTFPMLMLPAHSLSAGGGFKGLMERDRRKFY